MDKPGTSAQVNNKRKKKAKKVYGNAMFDQDKGLYIHV